MLIQNQFTGQLRICIIFHAIIAQLAILSPHIFQTHRHKLEGNCVAKLRMKINIDSI